MATKTKKGCLWIIGIVLALVLLLFVAGMLRGFQQSTKAMPSVSKGRLELYPDFKSQYLPARDVAVWLPEDYQLGDSCDVLYMHDGQMLFDASTTWNHKEWKVDETMDTLIRAGKIRRCIVVGIYNTDDRLNEYFPDKTWQYVPEASRQQTDTTLFHGDEYLQFIVNELKPFIDERYRPLKTREHTFIMGSSMGGLISLYALCEYPQVFSGAGCISPHISMAHLDNGIDDEIWPEAFLKYVDAHLPEAGSVLLYFDCGTRGLDDDYGNHLGLLEDLLRAKGWNENHYRLYTAWGHGHDETSWAKRLNEPLTFLLGTVQ